MDKPAYSLVWRESRSAMHELRSDSKADLEERERQLQAEGAAYVGEFADVGHARYILPGEYCKIKRPPIHYPAARASA